MKKKLDDEFRSAQDIIDRVDPDMGQCDYCKRYRHLNLLVKDVGWTRSCNDRRECRSYIVEKQREEMMNPFRLGTLNVVKKEA